MKEGGAFARRSSPGVCGKLVIETPARNSPISTRRLLFEEINLILSQNYIETSSTRFSQSSNVASSALWGGGNEYVLVLGVI
jgi:hypothetical protein